MTSTRSAVAIALAAAAFSLAGCFSVPAPVPIAQERPRPAPSATDPAAFGGSYLAHIVVDGYESKLISVGMPCNFKHQDDGAFQSGFESIARPALERTFEDVVYASGSDATDALATFDGKIVVHAIRSDSRLRHGVINILSWDAESTFEIKITVFDKDHNVTLTRTETGEAEMNLGTQPTLFVRDEACVFLGAGIGRVISDAMQAALDKAEKTLRAADLPAVPETTT